MKSLPISFILKTRKAITFKILYTMFSMNKSLCELQKRCTYQQYYIHTWDIFMITHKEPKVNYANVL